MTLLSLILLLTPSASAGRRDVVPDAVEDALAFAQADRARAIEVLQTALASAKPREIDALQLHIGEQFRLSNEIDKAREHLSKAAVGKSRSARDAGTIGLLLIETKNGVSASQLAALRRADERSLPDTMNADRYLLLAVQSTREDDAKNAGRHSKEALQFAASDPEVLARVSGLLDTLREAGVSGVETAVQSGGEGPLSRARKALAAGNMSKASALANDVLAKEPADSPEAFEAGYVLKLAQATTPIDPNRIAVLLPLYGKYESAAKQVKEALEFGYAKGGGTKDLVYYDTGATTEETVAALEKAVLDDGSVAVVGPLLSDTTDAMVKAAAALQVPLLSLSQSNEERENPWIYQGVPSIGDQTAALVKYMMVEENKRSFATFAPDTTYGHTAAEAFKKSVEARKGKVTHEVFYDPNSNALMKDAKKLASKDNSRQDELKRLRELATAEGRDPANVSLPPKVDFEALFLPERASKIPIACAALAFEEFAIGGFRPQGGEPITLIGLNGWNDKSLVAAGGEYIYDSRFTETYVAGSSSAFESAYKASTSRTPSALEAVTADAGRLLGAIGSLATDSREGFREALAGVATADTATGASGLPDRRVDTSIAILAIDRHGIRPVGTAPPPKEETP